MAQHGPPLRGDHGRARRVAGRVGRPCRPPSVSARRVDAASADFVAAEINRLQRQWFARLRPALTLSAAKIMVPRGFGGVLPLPTAVCALSGRASSRTSDGGVETARSGKAGGSASDADLARRLDRLSRDLDAEKRERAAAERPARVGRRGLCAGLPAGERVRRRGPGRRGARLGHRHVAGTSPWGLIGFLLLGFCAGVLNVVRAAGRMSSRRDERARTTGPR